MIIVIIAKFVNNKKGNKNTHRQPGGKANYINERKEFISFDEPVSSSEIIFEHDYYFSGDKS